MFFRSVLFWFMCGRLSDKVVFMWKWLLIKGGEISLLFVLIILLVFVVMFVLIVVICLF